ncbi:MAG: hypothetical protein FWH44_06390, partial [Methanomassiliicoccaceae archaeon]|nr:hypothetical protein [Methanomassiliicoccaceae archaeon]
AVDIMITNCYNIGDAAGNPAGGIAGLLSLSNSAVLIANCYNAGDMTAASKGGILGGASGSATDIAVINCYYLEGVPLCGAGIASLTVDGENAGTYPDNTYDPVRNADQFTGERTPEEMKASLSNALKNKTIYFIGTTDTDTMFGEVAGWDFESGDIWTIISYINDGYPVFKVMYPDDEDDDDDDDTPLWPWIVIVLLGVLFLLIFLDDDEEEVTGRVTHNGNGLSGVTVSYTVDGKSGSVKTNGKGIYVIDVDEGSVISITGVVKSGYSVNEALPLTFTVSKDITEVNFTMQ